MRTVIDASEETSVETVVTATDRPATLTTTLYDLIAAVQDVAGPDNDALIVAAVQHLLRAGLVTWGNGVVAYGNRHPEPLGGRRRPIAVSA